MGLHQALHTPGFRWRFCALTALLGVLGYTAVNAIQGPVPRDDVAGTYRLAPHRLLPVDSLPAGLQLHDDGTLILLSGTGDTLKRCQWHWEEVERLVRTSAPDWDRRIRIRSSLGGHRLAVRIASTPLILDDNERFEEAEYIRSAIAPENARHP